jgi:Phage tail tube, TTP, lambda-like
MKLKDKGTVFYGVIPSLSPPVLALGCITGIDGLGGAASQIDVTCFSDTEMRYEGGKPNPGQITISGIYDTEDDIFPELVALKRSQEVVGWYIGGSDGTDPPTEASDGGVEPPTTRTGIDFEGYVADITWQIQANNTWRYQLMIQRSGEWNLTRKAP